MKRNFERSLSAVLAHEGGYINHRADPGGPTNLGVTLGVAKRLGIDVDGDGDTDIIDIKLLKPADAAKVYRHEYWDKVRGDDLPDGVDYAVFDFAVNSGVSRSAKFLQTIVGVQTDGKIGPDTLEAVANVPRTKIITELCNRRQAFLERLGTFATFGKGWTARVKSVRTLATQLATQGPQAEPAVAPAPKPRPIPTVPLPEPVQGRGGIPGWVYVVGVLLAIAAAAFFLPIIPK